MFDASRPVYEPLPPRRGGALLRLLGWSLLTLALCATVGGFVAWRWADDHLRTWGVRDAAVDTGAVARLVAQAPAFQLATVQQTYAADAHVSVEQTLRAGPLRYGLPAWAAGQRLDARGAATVTAGVDLAAVGADDLTVTRAGKETRVTLRLPAPRVLSTELAPGTLDLDTDAGLLNRLRAGAGLPERDLRDRAADEVAATARQAALDGGILTVAAAEAERRLTAFLAALPHASGERVTYTVQVARPAAQ